jgi:hypothetical protein
MQGASGPQTFMPPDYVDPYVTDGDTSELDAIQVSLRGEDGGSFPLKGTTCCEPRWPAQAAARHNAAAAIQQMVVTSVYRARRKPSCTPRRHLMSAQLWTCLGEACRGWRRLVY